jgi:hypothetical protein
MIEAARLQGRRAIAFCRRNGYLYGVECHAGDRCVRREVQIRDIIDWKPFTFPVIRLLKGHIQLSAIGVKKGNIRGRADKRLCGSLNINWERGPFAQ